MSRSPTRWAATCCAGAGERQPRSAPRCCGAMIRVNSAPMSRRWRPGQQLHVLIGSPARRVKAPKKLAEPARAGILSDRLGRARRRRLWLWEQEPSSISAPELGLDTAAYRSAAGRSARHAPSRGAGAAGRDRRDRWSAPGDPRRGPRFRSPSSRCIPMPPLDPARADPFRDDASRRSTISSPVAYGDALRRAVVGAGMAVPASPRDCRRGERRSRGRGPARFHTAAPRLLSESYGGPSSSPHHRLGPLPRRPAADSPRRRSSSPAAPSTSPKPRRGAPRGGAPSSRLGRAARADGPCRARGGLPACARLGPRPLRADLADIDVAALHAAICGARAREPPSSDGCPRRAGRAPSWGLADLDSRRRFRGAISSNAAGAWADAVAAARASRCWASSLSGTLRTAHRPARARRPAL